MAFLHRPWRPKAAPRGCAREGAVPCAAASRPWVLAATILASAMAFIDGSVVTIALPVLQRELGAGLAALQWVVNGYTLFLGRAAPRRRRGGRPLRAAAGVPGRHRASSRWPRRLRAGAGIGRLIAARAVQGDRRGDDGAAEPRHHLGRLPARDPRPGDRHLGRGGVDHHRARAGGRRASWSTASAGGRRSGSTCRWRSPWWRWRARTCPRAASPAAGPLDWAGRRAGGGGLGAADARADGAGRARGGGVDGGGAARRRRRWRASAFVRVERRAAAPLVPLSALRLAGLRRGEPDDALPLRCAVGGDVPAAVRADRPARAQRRRGGAGPAADGAGHRRSSPGRRARWPTGSACGRSWWPARCWSRGLRLAGSRPPAGAGARAWCCRWSLLAAGMALVVAPLTTAVMNAAPDALAGAASGVNNAASRLAGLFAVALIGAVAAMVFARGGRPAGGALRGVPAGRRSELSPRSPAPSTAPMRAGMAAARGAGGAGRALAALADARRRRPCGFFARGPLDGGARLPNLC